MLFRVQFTLAGDKSEEAALWLTQEAPQGWEEENGDIGSLGSGDSTNGNSTFRVYVGDEALAYDLAKRVAGQWPASAPRVTEIVEEEWALAWRDYFTPITAGGVFEIVPPWLNKDEQGPDKRIVIEPKMAFGTGHHATTALCLTAIANLHAANELPAEPYFLDLGTGSGILAIGLAMLGGRGVALDIDPQAVVCARENIEANRVADKIEVAVGSLDCLSSETKFNTIVANILSGPLTAMAPSMAARLAPGGRLILSGILGEQADGVIQAYRTQGFGEPEVLPRDEWVAIIW